LIVCPDAEAFDGRTFQHGVEHLSLTGASPFLRPFSGAGRLGLRQQGAAAEWTPEVIRALA
jgi:hypothetical protein